jgi:hypothetical protein
VCSHGAPKAAAAAASHLVHAPRGVDVQHLDQPLFAGRVDARDRVDHARRREVALRGGMLCRRM